VPFTEDLSLFFDTDFAGTPAEIKDKAGAHVRAANVILDTPTDAVLEDGTVVATTPSVMGREADLSDVRKDYTLTVAGTVYVVAGPPRNDGTGLSTVGLRKQ
jgi:hypothetical protein